MNFEAFDCVVIGSGPAGLMAANILEKNNLNYLLLDKNNFAGRKLLITGGKRCNVTNIYNPKEFIDELKFKHRRFLYSTLSKYGTQEILEFFNENNVELALEKKYQYFPKSSKSSDILNALLENIDQRKILLNTTVTDITKENNSFIIETNQKDYITRNVILATGSKSYPKTGSTGDGIIFSKNLGHSFTPFYPAETHVYSEQVKKDKEFLQGISLLDCEVTIKGEKKAYSGGVIFTHFGLSGPLIQNISELIYFNLQNNETELLIRLTTKNITEILEYFEAKENQKARVIRIVEKLTIKRLARFILKISNIDETKLVANISKKEKQTLIENLLRFTVKIDRVENISNSFVNGGGIKTSEVNPKTMESKLVDGLFFAGELLDIHGPIGGFNITMALSTGYTAASSIRRKDNA